MNESLSSEILAAMADVLSCSQLKKLGEVLRVTLTDRTEGSISNEDVLAAFLKAKKVEGHS
mgnify:CR=1 FL=1